MKSSIKGEVPVSHTATVGWEEGVASVAPVAPATTIFLHWAQPAHFCFSCPVQSSADSWLPRSFFRSDKLVGTAHLKLERLENECEIREILEVGHRDCGGRAGKPEDLAGVEPTFIEHQSPL